MITLRITDQNTGLELATAACAADTLLSRLRGLLGTTSLPAGQGLLITPCNSVHMIGMKYAIDVVFLDKEFTVLKIVSCLQPYSFAGCWQAVAALELPAGTIATTKTQVGHRLQVVKYSSRE